VEATEPVAAAAGFLYVVLAIARRRECWIAGGLSSALYVWVLLDARLPMQAVLQLLYVVLAVYGWFAWSSSQGDARPRSWSLRAHGLAIVVVAAAALASAPLIARYGQSVAPLAESLGTWASVAATWMLARRCVESWLWWVVVDAGLAVLFAIQGLAWTAALYAAYTLLAAAGWHQWRRAMARS
jgi:nicotinamide mononucleotide transporter